MTGKIKHTQPREVIFVRVRGEVKDRLRKMARSRKVTVNRLAADLFEDLLSEWERLRNDKTN